MSDDAKIIPFGKYKGRLIDEVLVDDPGYLQWLAGQDWFRTKFTILHQVIINRGSEPEETPEHNALQVKFLDEDFRDRFVRCLIPDLSFVPESDVDFEVNGVDVVLETSLERKDIPGPLRSLFRYCDERGRYATQDFKLEHFKGPFWAELRVELKPTVGDDYPAILRQMKANGSSVLLLRDYVGTGATREQFIKTFMIADKRVVFLHDVEAMSEPGGRIHE